jgi:tetratricopeptide (TPR) repeat protein
LVLEIRPGFGDATLQRLCWIWRRDLLDALGDGLFSGSTRISYRPPWNNDLMNLGYLLAIPLTLLLLIGSLTGFFRLLRSPAPGQFLINGLLLLFGAGIIFMALRIPSYAQVKAFYALPTLVPLSALLALGWQVVCRDRVYRLVAWGLLLTWASTTYGAFWISDGNPETQITRGISLTTAKRYGEAAESFSRALQLEPVSLAGRVGLAHALHHLGRDDEALRQAAAAEAEHPAAAEAHLELGSLLAATNRLEEAVAHLRQAIQLAPDHPLAYQRLANYLARLQSHSGIIDTCEQGLRVNAFNEDLHYSLGRELAQTGDLSNSLAHFEFALELKPNWPEARASTAGALDALGNLPAAIAQYEQAIALEPRDSKAALPLRFDFSKARKN